MLLLLPSSPLFLTLLNSEKRVTFLKGLKTAFSHSRQQTKFLFRVAFGLESWIVTWWKREIKDSYNHVKKKIDTVLYCYLLMVLYADSISMRI